MADRIPLIVLAGSDRRAGVLPEGAEELHALTGIKGLDVRLDGRPLIDHAVERFSESGAFGPIYVAGPAAAYGDRRGVAEVVDTDGSFADNIQAGLDRVLGEFPQSDVALTTCDVLPTTKDLEVLVNDYRNQQPLEFWFPAVEVREPRRLGTSAWKPRYWIRPKKGEPAVSILPGHLLIATPAIVDVALVVGAFGAAYRSRNRPVLERLLRISGSVLKHLLARDARQVARLRPPVVTARTLFHAGRLAWRLRAGKATEAELAWRLRRMFVDPEHQRRNPSGGGRLHIFAAVSLAKDLDTLEEVEEARRSLQPDS